jgi:predicted Fe-S protein YdhL (DUF1289 family)
VSNVNEKQRRLARAKRREERRHLPSGGPPSPCVSCQIDPRTGWCFGSHRTIGESRDRIVSRPDERQKILDALAARQFGNAG